MDNKLCDFNLKTGYRGDIMCDEGYKKYRVQTFKDDQMINVKFLCRFCLDRYVSDMTDKGFEVRFTKLSGEIANGWT